MIVKMLKQLRCEWVIIKTRPIMTGWSDASVLEWCSPGSGAALLNIAASSGYSPLIGRHCHVTRRLPPLALISSSPVSAQFSLSVFRQTLAQPNPVQFLHCLLVLVTSEHGFPASLLPSPLLLQLQLQSTSRGVQSSPSVRPLPTLRCQWSMQWSYIGCQTSDSASSSKFHH